jgi:phosphoglycolate phosphatase-like HAD superfamily hydrolase
MTSLLALFDIDGTLLLGNDPVSNAAFLPALRELYAVDLPADAVARVDHPGQTCQRIAREVLRAEGLADDAIDERLGPWCALYAERYVSLLADASTIAWRAAPHTAEALERLSDEGIRLALLTGNPEPMARARMARLGLDRFFAQGQGAFGCDAEERSALIHLARERAGGWPRDRTVAVGDTPRDVSGAHAAGIRVVSVEPGDDLNEVADVLIAWNRQS